MAAQPWVPDISGELRVLLAEAEENSGTTEQRIQVIVKRAEEAQPKEVCDG